MRTVTRHEISQSMMVAGNEEKYSKIILDGKVLEWVAIGWIEIDDKPDMRKYPVVIDS